MPPARRRSQTQFKFRLSRSCPLPGEQLFHATRDEHGHVDQDAGQGDAAGRHEIARLPHRIELRLVTAQSLEVVEVLAMPEHEIAHAMPGGRERVALETGERRHAEIEPAITLLASPQHEL